MHLVNFFNEGSGHLSLHQSSLSSPPMKLEDIAPYSRRESTTQNFSTTGIMTPSNFVVWATAFSVSRAEAHPFYGAIMMGP